MDINLLQPRKALNKAFLKVNPTNILKALESNFQGLFCV